MPASVMDEFSHPLDLLYGLVALTCCLVGFPGNCFAARHFYQKKRDAAQINYLLISLNDCLVCLMVLPTGISFLMSRDPGMLESSVICHIWATLSFIVMRMAVFLTMILSVNRTISLMFPFRRSSYRTPLLSVTIFFTFIASQLIVTYWWGFKARYNTYLVGCMWSGDNSDQDVLSKAMYLEVSMILTYVLPVFLVSLGCIFSTIVLFQQSGVIGDTTFNRKHRASKTIVIFTVIYLLFNIPLATSVVLQTVGVHTNWTINLLKFDYANPPYLFYFKNFINVISTALNSAINPLVYLWRFKEYGRSLRDSSRRLSQILGRSISMRANREQE